MQHRCLNPGTRGRSNISTKGDTWLKKGTTNYNGKFTCTAMKKRQAHGHFATPLDPLMPGILQCQAPPTCLVAAPGNGSREGRKQANNNKWDMDGGGGLFQIWELIRTLAKSHINFVLNDLQLKKQSPVSGLSARCLRPSRRHFLFFFAASILILPTSHMVLNVCPISEANSLSHHTLYNGKFGPRVYM